MLTTIQKTVSTSSNDIRIAYLLQVHKNPKQVNMFIQQIAGDGQPDIYIHIDKKSVREVSNRITKGRNIKVTKDSISVRWGDISQVDATICLLRSMRASHKKYDFVCFKSGQDLLIKNGLKEHLAGNKHKIFMNAKKIRRSAANAYFWDLKWPRFTRNRYDSILHPHRISRAALITVFKIGINLIPNPNSLSADFALYRGSQWFTIPGDVAEYITDYLDHNPWYYEAFKHSLCPDESFFQTLVMNSPYAGNLVNDNLTYLRFGKSYEGNNHPVTLTIKDVPEIEQSGKFFARKFDQTIDRKIVEYFCHKCKC